MDQPELDPEVVEWIRSRPESVKVLMRAWPPSARVKAREGVELMVPAPGVEGRVNSYYESGLLGIVGPMSKTVTSPITGVTLAEGMMISAQCRPEQLELVSFGEADGIEITPALIDAVLEGE